jgi:hypothetical protein
MRAFFARAGVTSYLLGSVLCSAHLVISWQVIIGIASSEPDAQWQLIWIFFLPFDLPFSLLVMFCPAIFPDWTFGSLPYPLGDFRAFILPSIIHGVVGPLWYFFVPVAISSLLARHQERKAARRGARSDTNNH